MLDGPPIPSPLGPLTWRPRTDDDVGLLRALFAASRRAELDLMGGDPDQERAFVDLQLRARDRHRDATRPRAALGIVTLDGIAVGQLDLDQRSRVVEVVEIALVPGLQGHGLGTAVLGRVLADAEAAGLPVRLDVEHANPARRLYERLGFVVVGSAGPLHLTMERLPSSGVIPPPLPATAVDTTTDVPAGPDRSGIPSYGDLAPRLGSPVAVVPDGPVLELIAVDAHPRRSPGATIPYSALLAGPLDRPLAQGIHRLDLPGTGPVDLFIVPLEPADDRARYELIVS